MANIFVQPCDEGVIRGKRHVTACSRKTEPWILAATILGSSMAFIDGTVVNVALPALQSSFNASARDMLWVVESYALCLAALILVGGSLGDRYGRRRVFCAGTALFALASIGCGLAPGVRQLIVARAAQGAAGALLVPGSLAIISASFPEDRRGAAIGTWSGFTAITAAIGPVIGGWLIEHVSWRAVFFINVPIALVVLAISYWRVPETRDDSQQKRLDWLGAGLATIGLGCVVFGLIESSRSGFAHPSVIISLAAGTVSLALFIIVEARSTNPMLPLTLFRSRNFSGANLVTLFLYTALSGALFFLPLNLIQVQGYTATEAGASLLPFILIMFILSRWAGGVVKRYGSKLPLVVGPIIVALGFGLFILPDAGGSYWSGFFPAVAVLGLGMAISVAPLTTTVMNAVAANRAGVASGINNAVSRTAGLLGVAVLGIVILHAYNAELNERLSQMSLPDEARRSIDEEHGKLAAYDPPAGISDETRRELKTAVRESFVDGFRVVMMIAAALALASALTAFVMIGGKVGVAYNRSVARA